MRTVRGKITVGILSVAVLAGLAAMAADVKWIAGEASWHTVENWDTGNPPTDVDRAIITNGGKPVVTADVTITNMVLSNSALRVESGTLSLTAASASLAYASSGTVEITGGVLTNNGTLVLGDTTAGDSVPGPGRGFITLRMTGGRIANRGELKIADHTAGCDVDLAGEAEIYSLGNYTLGGRASAAYYAGTGRPRTIRIRERAKLHGAVSLTQCNVGFDTTVYIEDGAIVSNYTFGAGYPELNYTVTNVWIVQTGGTNFVRTQGGVFESRVGTNTYELRGGLFDSPGIWEVGAYKSSTIAATGTAAFVQSGGLAKISDLRICRTPFTDAATGVYHLVGGVLDNLNGRIGVCTQTIAGLHGTGILKLGDQTGSGVITNCGGLFLLGSGITNLTARALVWGWGDIYATRLVLPLTGCTGRYEVVADGYGNQRTLRFARPGMAVVNGMDNTAANGWYARNGGRLELPPLPIKAGNFTTNWAESGDDADIDLVNSMRLVFNSVTATGFVSVALLATNRSEVTFAPQDRVIGVWEISRAAGLTFSTVDLTVRYDHVEAANQGLADSDLDLYRYNGTKWVSLGAVVDAEAKTLTASGVVQGSETSFWIAAGRILGFGARGTLWILR